MSSGAASSFFVGWAGLCAQSMAPVCSGRCRQRTVKHPYAFPTRRCDALKSPRGRYYLSLQRWGVPVMVRDAQESGRFGPVSCRPGR